MNTKSHIAIWIVAVALLCVPSAQAAPVVLDFNMDGVHPATARVSYNGLGGPLVGVDISVDNVVGLDTPLNDGVIKTIAIGRLNFTTGNLTHTDASSWYFGPGGSINITGDAGFGPALLLTGTLTYAEVVNIGGPLQFKVAISNFVDRKDEQLADFYGVGGNQQWSGNFNLSFSAAGTPPNSFVSTRVLSGDVVNSPVANLPEPSSLALLCLGLGLAAARRFKKRNL